MDRVEFQDQRDNTGVSAMDFHLGVLEFPTPCIPDWEQKTGKTQTPMIEDETATATKSGGCDLPREWEIQKTAASCTIATSTQKKK